MAGAIGFDSLDDLLTIARTAQVVEPHDDIGPGQTVPFRIKDVDLDHNGTLIRTWFRACGAGRCLRDRRFLHGMAGFCRKSRPR